MPTPQSRLRSADPRRLRELLDKVVDLAGHHSLTSVVVGMAAAEGDLVYPDVVDFVTSALRADDFIVRLTRERSVLFLTDVDRERAEGIVARLLEDFSERFPTAEGVSVSLAYFEVTPARPETPLRDVLLSVFPGKPAEASTH